MLERLQKIIARAGIASRRHAEELILGGQVRVNGEVVNKLGAKADLETDRVEVAGKLAERPAEPAYYMLHKPVHVVSTMSDPEGRATLRHLLRGLSGGLFPVGRLDYAASGLLLLTSDGELANRIMKVSASMPKVYWIKIKGRPGEELLRNIRHRAHARLRLLSSPGSAKKDAANPWYEAELGEARRDLLRRELFAADHPVEKMKRVKVGPLDLGDLPEAHYRKLDPAEITKLRQAIDRAEKAPHSVRTAADKGRGPGNRRHKRLREAPKPNRSNAMPAVPEPDTGATQDFTWRVPQPGPATPWDKPQPSAATPWTRPQPSADAPMNKPQPRAGSAGKRPQQGSGFSGNRQKSGANFRGNRPRPSGGFARSRPKPSGSFAGNRQKPDGGFAGKRPQQGSGFAGNRPKPSGSFAGNRQKPGSGFAGNRPQKGPGFAGNRPKHGAGSTWKRPKRGAGPTGRPPLPGTGAPWRGPQK